MIQNGGGAGQAVMGGQVVQTADGQTVIYQVPQNDAQTASATQQAQPQIIQVGGQGEYRGSCVCIIAKNTQIDHLYCYVQNVQKVQN